MTDTVDPIPWPIAQLPFFAEHGSWQEGLESAVADFPVEVGPSKRRRRTYLPSTRVQFRRIVSGSELSAFIDFFEGTLRSGIYNFTAVDPRTGQSTEYQFLQVPTWDDVTTTKMPSGPNTTYWRLQFTLRRVNLAPATSSPP